METFDLNGKVMIITGASRGIGRGLVDYFLEKGVRIAAIVRNEQSAEALLSEVGQNNSDFVAYPLDLTDTPKIQQVFDKIAEDFGQIDILVNNAGMGNPIPALEVTENDWDVMMDINLKSPFFCAQAAAKHMLKQKYGRIINISSQGSVIAIDGEAVYCASKGGLNQLTKVLALEWSKHGVTVNAVGPTFTYTPGTAERLDNPEFRANVLANIPRGRIGKIEDTASAIHYLSSDQADLVNGHLLLVDGGWTII